MTLSVVEDLDEQGVDVVYSVAGEGRGHATRARAVIEALRGDYRLLVFASTCSYPILMEAFEEDPKVTIRPIPGLSFHHRGTRVDYPKSLSASLPYLRRLRGLTRSLARELVELKPALAIVDFDPALPRAARLAGVPYVSFDHQHFLVVNDLSSVPLRLRWKAWLLGATVGLVCKGQRRTIVSSFFDLPLKRSASDAVLVGPLLRREVLEARVRDDGHIVAYTKGSFPANVMEVLRSCGLPVRLYGHGTGPSEGNIEKRPVGEKGFLEDLVSCHAVLCNAGNQLIGEARYLGKPVFALPEPGNFEQELNAHFIKASSIGVAMPAAEVSADHFGRFLREVDQKRPLLLEDANRSGNERSLSVLRHEIESSRSRVRGDQAGRPAAQAVPARSA